jgi:transposase-like protein
MLSMTGTGKKCLACASRTVRVVEAMGLDGWVDCFLCSTCGHTWNLPKRRDDSILTPMTPNAADRRVRSAS